MVAEPFEKGYALTVGNSLRRVLLAAIPGAAVAWVRIDGLTASSGKLPGVVEDVPTLLLNLKKVVTRLPEGAAAPAFCSWAGIGWCRVDSPRSVSPAGAAGRGAGAGSPASGYPALSAASGRTGYPLAVEPRNPDA